jgi:hypothetical protein
MKPRVFIIAFFLLTLPIQGQDTGIEPIVEMKDADTQPSFYAGPDALYEFIAQNFKKPEIPELIGKIFLSFITDIATVRDVGFDTGAEAQRVMQLSPKWIPGRKDGKVVRVKYYLPIPIHTD